MIAVDTNILVFAHRSETMKHAAAVRQLTSLAECGVPWAIPVFCIGEFIRVVTHRRVFDPPSTIDQALDAIAALVESPSLRILTPGNRYIRLFSEVVREGAVAGNLVFDAQIVAVCREHGITELLSDDRDFHRFAHLRVTTLPN